MKVYIAHPTSIDYRSELYAPLKADKFFDKYNLILPHETSNQISNTRGDYKDIDCVIAECSAPSLGVGIELGWCYDDNIPIYIFYKNGDKPSESINMIANKIIQYENSEDFVEKVKEIILNLS